MRAKRMRTIRQQLIEEPATLADRTANGAGADTEPARQLALEALKAAYASMEGSCSANHRIALNTVDAAIRALSSPDHADADHAQARDVLARFRDYVIEGITAGTIMRGGEHHNPIWQEVASVLHVDAGKVEGDGWLPIESAPKDGTEIWGWHKVAGPAQTRFYDGEWCCVDWDEDQYIACTWEPTHWRPLPSAPASEGAE